MSDEWYSRKPQTRFSREHREQLPAGARMVDIDGVIWAPYIKGADTGGPIMLVEFKPEKAREDFWLVTQRLGRACGLPCARVIEQANGLYQVDLCEPPTWVVRRVGTDMTIHDWFEQVEWPIREANGHRRIAA